MYSTKRAPEYQRGFHHHSIVPTVAPTLEFDTSSVDSNNIS